MKGGTNMATNTFERKIVIRDSESLDKLTKVINSEPPVKPLSKHPFSKLDKDRSEALLRRCLSRSKR